MEFLATTDLEILNVGSKPTFVNRIREQVIDVTFVTQSMAHRIKNWHVSEHETLSDHKEINFFIECDPKGDKLFRNIRNTDWDTFNSVLRSRISNKKHKFVDLCNKEKIDSAVNFLTKAMKTSFISACPGRIIKPKKNHWWNDELQKMKLETRKLRRIAENSRGKADESEYWLKLRNSKTLYTRELRRAKMCDWENMCETIEGTSALSRLQKVLAKDPSKGPGVLKKLIHR